MQSTALPFCDNNTCVNIVTEIPSNQILILSLYLSGLLFTYAAVYVLYYYIYTTTCTQYRVCLHQMRRNEDSVGRSLNLDLQL